MMAVDQSGGKLPASIPWLQSPQIHALSSPQTLDSKATMHQHAWQPQKLSTLEPQEALFPTQSSLTLLWC